MYMYTYIFMCMYIMSIFLLTWKKLEVKEIDQLPNCVDKETDIIFVGRVVRRDMAGKDVITGMVFGKCRK